MRFDPNATTTLLPENWYECSVDRAEETTSKKGNAMMKVTFRVYAGNTQQLIWEYFLPGTPASLTRFKKLCKAIGADFDAGEVTPEMLQGQSLEGFVKIHEDEQYGDKNVVAQFRAIGSAASTPQQVESAPAVADPNVPF